jgi:hypothetical protein
MTAAPAARIRSHTRGHRRGHLVGVASASISSVRTPGSARQGVATDPTRGPLMSFQPPQCVEPDLRHHGRRTDGDIIHTKSPARAGNPVGATKLRRQRPVRGSACGWSEGHVFERTITARTAGPHLWRALVVACDMAHRPTVLILDEPSSGFSQREPEVLRSPSSASERNRRHHACRRARQAPSVGRPRRTSTEAADPCGPFPHLGRDSDSAGASETSNVTARTGGSVARIVRLSHLLVP